MPILAYVYIVCFISYFFKAQYFEVKSALFRLNPSTCTWSFQTIDLLLCILIYDYLLDCLYSLYILVPGGIHQRIYSAYFIHLVVCLTTGPKPLPKRALHLVRSRASSFKWEYPVLSLRSPSSFLCLFPRLPVTSIPPFIFPSITRCRRQFLCQLAFRLLI